MDSKKLNDSDAQAILDKKTSDTSYKIYSELIDNLHNNYSSTVEEDFGINFTLICHMLYGAVLLFPQYEARIKYINCILKEVHSHLNWGSEGSFMVPLYPYHIKESANQE